MKTRILHVPVTGKDDSALGHWAGTLPDGRPDLSRWVVAGEDQDQITETTNGTAKNTSNEILTPLREAAHLLRTSAIPVAFPTETVYGLGADATRSDAVRGIYTAKGRPSDNPLIVHVCDLDMLRGLVRPGWTRKTESATHQQQEGGEEAEEDDPIPSIYHPLIQHFWPGPLTILLPLPTPPETSPLAPEVTSTLPTFGARLPSSSLARTLIRLTSRPLAAPSANASTRPSPTTAQHVYDDLHGKIELVLDGGACEVGVESTVVDGLCVPPVVLRPGGVGVEEIRGVGNGWEGVVRGYGDGSHQEGEGKGEAPRAPGMKYKHYSPRARVVLFEGGNPAIDLEGVELEGKTVGVIRTSKWPLAAGLRHGNLSEVAGEVKDAKTELTVKKGTLLGENGTIETGTLLDVDLGQDIKGVAHGLFAALRELDRLGADVILVEGVGDGDDMAAAVMNRLRKAASEIRV
ncbi:DHBP synthase RibB-like alpha/beta domain-containing protein [Chaetomium sp. MPI-SDFR-AT-0129]|nr:DHBP synthase RibB-like alpha/beta domain-containing protein [Chaetomium sp. MPI-SDFR-AT-0129]